MGTDVPARREVVGRFIESAAVDVGNNAVVESTEKSSFSRR